MKQINRVRVELVRESSALYETNIIGTPMDAARIAKQFIGKSDRENCIVMCLDTKNKVNAIHTVSIGTLNLSLVHPREVFKIAILANSASIVVAHNHPSGDVKPSQEDIDITTRLKEAGELLNIKLLDHVIVNDEPDIYKSMVESGYM